MLAWRYKARTIARPSSCHASTHKYSGGSNAQQQRSTGSSNGTGSGSSSTDTAATHSGSD